MCKRLTCYFLKIIMKKTTIFICTVLFFVVSISNALAATPAQARSVCKQFLQRSGYVAQDWGNYWDWTTIDNRDGTYSVGARFVGMAPGRGVSRLYVSCVVRADGNTWQLESLSRLQ